MGSKNRIFLGLVTALILHSIRNIYSKSIFMSKRVQSKIQIKHPEVFRFTSKEGFTLLLSNTIAVVSYKGLLGSNNFIASVNDEYILYSLKQDKYHTSCSTIFRLKPETLKKYYKDDSFKLLKKNCEEDIKEYMN